jgi:hypothetical protein
VRNELNALLTSTGTPVSLPNSWITS